MIFGARTNSTFVLPTPTPLRSASAAGALCSAGDSQPSLPKAARREVSVRPSFTMPSSQSRWLGLGVAPQPCEREGSRAFSSEAVIKSTPQAAGGLLLPAICGAPLGSWMVRGRCSIFYHREPCPGAPSEDCALARSIGCSSLLPRTGGLGGGTLALERGGERGPGPRLYRGSVRGSCRSRLTIGSPAAAPLRRCWRRGKAPEESSGCCLTGWRQAGETGDMPIASAGSEFT